MVALGNKNLQLRTLKQGRIVEVSFQGHSESVLSAKFSPDGRTIASGSKDHTIRLWDRQGKLLKTFKGHQDAVNCIAYSPDGQIIASGSHDKTVKVWDLQNGKELYTLTEHKGSVTAVTFSPDGQMIASGSLDNTVKVWDSKNGILLHHLAEHELGVNTLVFSADGGRLASGSNDNTVRLWDMSTPGNLGDLIGEPFIHNNAVDSIVFINNQTIISGSADGTIYSWNILDSSKNQQWKGHKDAVSSIAVVNREFILSGSHDGTLRLWNIKTGKQLQQLPLRINIGQELQNDLAQGDDQLNIKIEIDALTNVLMLRKLKPPLAVGILGGWGSGKSFALHLMKQRINEIRSEALTEKQAWGESNQLFPYVGHIYQIEFDAWTYAKSNLWASLMQKVFFELNRQISLEEKLKTAGVDLLKGGQIWKALNNMSDEQRRQILDSNLTQDIFKETKSHDTWQNIESKGISSVLWDTLGKLRQQEVEKLREEQQSLLNKENDLREKEIEIEKQVDQKIREKSRALLWNPLKDELSKLMGITVDELESKVINKNDSEKVKITLNELEPEFWKSLWKTCKDNPTILCFFILSLIILLIISPWLSTQLNNLPLGGFSDSVHRIAQLLTNSSAFIFSFPFIEKIWKGWKNYKKQVKQVLERYQTQVIDEQEKLAQSRQTLVEIEKAKNPDLTELENKIKQQQAFVEQKQQQIGLTTTYKSLNDLIDTRLRTDPYSEQLGLLQQVKGDIEELTNRLVLQIYDSPDVIQKKKESFVRGPARVVLYIDDLDRCPPHKVVEVLEAVQLLVKTSLFIVVLAIDDRYISRALEDVYKGVLKRRGQPSGIDYLEKIIQIPYRMRSISPSNLKKYLESQMRDEEEQSETSEITSTPENPTSEAAKINTSKTAKTDSTNVDKAKKTNLTQSDKPKLETQALEPPKPKPSPQTSETISEIIKFTLLEFDLLANCAKHVDLSPRTGKRLINLYKILKIVWSHYPSLGLKEPDAKTKQIAITFLALSGRYPDFARHLFEEIGNQFEESSDSNENNPTLTWNLQALLDELKKQVSENDHHNQREWRKFEHDLRQMLKHGQTKPDPSIEISTTDAINDDSFSLDRETFNLTLSFCFVGDIGYDPDDYHHPQITNH